jgi:hypothetical protein
VISFRFIEDHRNTYPVRLMCAVLEVSPSGGAAGAPLQNLNANLAAGALAFASSGNHSPL